MRGATLVSMLDLLRIEMRRSTNPAHNNGMRDADVAMLRAKQEELWEAYAWPHLRVERFIALDAGQRYYGPPSDVRIDRILSVELKYGGCWAPLDVGIGPPQYTAYDSSLDERSWPVQRWQIAEDEEIEVWPIPDGSGTAADKEGYLRIVGIKSLSPFVADADTADLDDRLIVWTVAAELLEGQGDKRAAAVGAKAQQRLRKLTANLTARRTFKLFGGGNERGRKLHGPPTVHYRIVSS